MKLDMVKTASKVNDFFHDDLIEYLANAGMHKADLSSPQLTPDAVSHSNSNSAEDNIMKIFDYENKCWAVGCAINNCNRINRQILKSSIIKDMSDAEQIMNIGYSDRTFYRKKQEALCEFANRIQYWAFKFNTNIEELRVYQSEENCV